MIILKTIEMKECKDNWRVKWTGMTANMQDYDNPNYQDKLLYNERVGRGNAIQTNQQLKCSANHTVNYSCPAHAMVRPLMVAKGQTLVTITTECTHCR